MRELPQEREIELGAETGSLLVLGRLGVGADTRSLPVLGGLELDADTGSLIVLGGLGVGADTRFLPVLGGLSLWLSGPRLVRRADLFLIPRLLLRWRW